MKVMIFGAGQAGQMVRTWLPPGQELTGYIDNNEQIQGSLIGGVPVFSPREALCENACPDMIWLAILNQDTCRIAEEQLRTLGFKGEVETVLSMREKIDVRLASMRLLADQIRERGVPGSCAELGVYQGDFAAQIGRSLPGRDLFLFDTFEGFDAEDLAAERALGGRNAHAKEGDFGDTSVQTVLEKMADPEHVYICRGRFPESLAGGAHHARAGENLSEEELDQIRYCLVSLDTDLYEPTLSGLRYFYPRLERGGCILLHDYHSAQYPGVYRAAGEFADESGIYPVPLMDLHGTAVYIKGSES